MDEEVKDVKAVISDITETFLKARKDHKKLADSKSALESQLKELLSENKVQSLVFANQKITYKSSVRKSSPKVSEVLEYVHKQLLQFPECVEVCEQIMENIHLEIEANRTETTVNILRVSDNE